MSEQQEAIVQELGSSDVCRNQGKTKIIKEF